MPKFQYSGDANSIRIFSKNLVETGRPYLKDVEKEKLGVYLKLGFGGNYFINPNNQNYFSKWGVTNVFLYSFPVLMSKLFPLNSHPVISDTIYLNIYNLIWVVFFYLFFALLLKLSGFKENQICFFLLLLTFTSVIWYYFRAQTTEIFILTTTIAIFYYLKRCLISFSTFNIFFFSICLFLLVSIKNMFILLYPIFIIIFYVYFYKTHRKPFIHFLACAFISGLAFVILNYYQFGSMIETGYSQQGQYVPNFSFNLLQSTFGFMFSSQRSVFLYCPLLFLSIFYGRKYYQEERQFFLIILVTAVVFFLFFGFLYNWEGEWCVGPRFPLFILPLLSIPAIYFFKDLKKIFFSLPFILFFIYINFQIISVDFFSFHRIRYLYKDSINNPTIDSYLIDAHPGIQVYRFKNMYFNREPDFIYIYLLDKFGKEKAKEYVLAVERALSSNFLFF